VIQSLAYLGFTSPSADEWTTFGPDVLGLELVDPGPGAGPGTVRLRNDDATWRLAIHPGEANDLAYIGWTVADASSLAATAAAVRGAGIEVHDGDANLAADRCVDAVAWFRDPFGFRHEIAVGQASTPGSFTPGRPGLSFVTGEGGMGHVVLIVPDLDAATRLYQDVLGFRHSDDIETGLHVRFFHCNARHHSLAISAVPGMAGIHHLMLEVTDVDDVGRTYDLVQERGIPLAMTLGRHTNDHMTSFYVRTPSGFEIEYGAGGRLLDTTRPWTPERFDAMSYWGHKPPAEPLFPSILHPLSPVDRTQTPA
jgi:2,3-dihydroxybiphenyl 1,2-dioxygenase